LELRESAEVREQCAVVDTVEESEGRRDGVGVFLQFFLDFLGGRGGGEEEVEIVTDSVGEEGGAWILWKNFGKKNLSGRLSEWIRFWIW